MKTQSKKLILGALGFALLLNPASAAVASLPLAQIPTEVKTGFQYGLGILFMVGFPDYLTELTRYYRETERVTHPHICHVRDERFNRYWRKMQRRELRREKLVVFISTDITSYSGNLKTKVGLQSYYDNALSGLLTRFDEIQLRWNENLKNVPTMPRRLL